MRKKISQILVKNFMPTRQVAIGELSRLVNEENAKLAVSSMMHISDNAKNAERKRIKALVEKKRIEYDNDRDWSGTEALMWVRDELLK